MSANVECQRFFAFSKRVPKDVKRYCGICRQHGKLEETRGHICEYKDCECPKCSLVRSRRLVMSQQIRLRRAQDKRFQRTTEPEEADVIPILSTTGTAADAAAVNGELANQQLMDAKNMCYFCQKCKNHGILVWKKQHKRKCPFTNCNCDFCELIETRRRLDQHIKRRKSEPQKGGDGADHSDSEESVPRKKSTASLPAQMEIFAGTPSSDGVTQYWHTSPPGSLLSIPIGIAQDRIAEHQEEQAPLDALAAQISRIQQLSPEQIPSRQSPNSSINGQMAGSSTCSPPPTLFPMVSVEQQQQLLNQLLLSSLSPSSNPLPAFPALPMLPPENASMLAAAASQLPAAGNQLNNALFGQLMMNCLNNSAVPALPKLEVPEMQNANNNNISDPQREALLQIIAQLLLDQNDRNVQQQQAKQQKTFLDALSGINLNGMGWNEMQQFAGQQAATGGRFDAALLGTLTAQQQLKEMSASLLIPQQHPNSTNASGTTSPSSDGQPHQSAFTALQPGAFGLP